MEEQARVYFKNIYENFHAKRNSFHEIGVANIAVIQEKFDKMEANNKKVRQQMEADQAVNVKYHQVIKHARSITRTTKSDCDDTTLATQMSAFTASQAQITENKFVDMCQRNSKAKKGSTQQRPGRSNKEGEVLEEI